MNEYLEAIILGIVQGLTEFLPVSSDGHLELAKWALGNQDTAADSFMMTIILHFGTAFAIVWVFRKIILEKIRDLRKPEGRKFLLLVLISMIPAVIVGLGFEEQMTALFDRKIILVALMLFINGIMLIVSDMIRTRGNQVTPLRAFVIGIFQAIAILPGISRSGSTISSSVAMGIDRKDAAHFSFLIVLPLIFGKIAKDILDGTIASAQEKALPLALGFVVSFFVGIVACSWLLSIVQKAKLRYFGYYCIAISIVAVILRLTIWPN